MNREEVLFQMKRLYVLNDLTLSESNSEHQNAEACYAFTKLLIELEERYNAPLSEYIFDEENTIESCVEKILNPPERSDYDEEYDEVECFETNNCKDITFNRCMEMFWTWIKMRITKLFTKR